MYIKSLSLGLLVIGSFALGWVIENGQEGITVNILIGPIRIGIEMGNI